MEEEKHSRKKGFLLVFLLLLAALLAALPFALDRMSRSAGDGASILSAPVTRGEISRTVSGAGTVGNKDAVAATVPADVVLTGYAVADGDSVRAGDPVAYVDRVSVYRLIASLGEELESVTAELAEAQNTYASSYISSNVAGTVTAVYARAGDDIRSVMAQYGALAEVRLDNGTMLKISALSGTVLFAFISEGDEIFVNANLFSVSDVDTMGAYGALVLRHQKIEDQLAQLFQMYRDGYVSAPDDGMIFDVNETLVKKLALSPEDGLRIALLGSGAQTGDEPYLSDYISAPITSDPDEDGMATVEGVDGLVDLSRFPYAEKGDIVFMRYDIYTGLVDGVEEVVDIRFTPLHVRPSGSSGGGGGGGGSGGGGGMGGMSGMGRTGSASGSASAAGGDEVSLSTQLIASVVPMDEALISISIDELDILSLRVGYTAQVTIDALPGRVYEGVVTGVNTGLSNSGGNSKYTAEVTIARTPEMLDGMNVSCLVTIETLRDVLTIPAAALCDEDGAQVVYTAVSRDRSELSAPVPVEVGLSDGETLEILSGLSEGDTVWYKLYDTPEYSLSQPQSGSLGGFMSGRPSGLRA